MTTNPRTIFGKKLRSLIEYGQQQVIAKEAAIGAGLFSRYVNGKEDNPELDTLYRIAKAMGVEAYELIKADEDEYEQSTPSMGMADRGGVTKIRVVSLPAAAEPIIVAYPDRPPILFPSELLPKGGNLIAVPYGDDVLIIDRADRNVKAGMEGTETGMLSLPLMLVRTPKGPAVGYTEACFPAEETSARPPFLRIQPPGSVEAVIVEKGDKEWSDHIAGKIVGWFHFLDRSSHSVDE